mgnify:CR=1 FL=1
MLECILVNVADPIGDVLFFHKHFITLEYMYFPKGLLNRRETVKNFQKVAFFYLQNLSHCVGSCLRVVNVRYQTLKPEYLSC